MNAVIEQKDEVVRRSILDAAQQLFQQYGLGKTTMEDIAREIGRGKSSLYYYYTNKEEIFIAVIQREMKDVLREMRAAIDKETTAEGQFTIFALTRFRALRKRKVLYKIMGNEIQDKICLFQDIRASFNKTEEEVIRNILQYGITTKEFGGINEELDTVCFVALSTLRGLEFNLMLHDEELRRFENAPKMIHVATDMLLRAFK